LRRMLTLCLALNLVFGCIPWLTNVASVLGCMFLAMFAASGFVVLSVSYATQAYGAAHAGLIAGAGAGSWSAMVALMMPLFGRLFDLHRYGAAFVIAAAIPLFGFAGWLWLGSHAERSRARQQANLPNNR